jgi:Bacterial Ig-like domain (group 3)/Right handed beta helix region
MGDHLSSHQRGETTDMARQSELVGKPMRTAYFSVRRVRQRTLAPRRFAFDFLEDRQLLATITVNTVNDTAEARSTLSLRQAIEISDRTLSLSSLTSTQQALVSGVLSSPNTIDFNIPSSQGPLYNIALTSPLPPITSPVIINGYSQPGASPNTNGPGLADNAVLNVEINGTGAGSGANGLVITAGASTIQGLEIANFSSQTSGTGGNGIDLQSTEGDLVAGNFIESNAMGILIAAGATSNTVGGITSAARNLISGNSGSGVQIGATTDVRATSGNVVAGNWIGTDATGLLALGNGSGSNPAGDGVDLIGVNSIDNTVGGSVAAAGNLISGNAYDGIYLDYASKDTLEFNLIGADAASDFTNSSLGNAANGIELDDAPNITIAKNLVVNNQVGGIALFYPQTANDLIRNNEIILNNGDGILFCSCGDGGSAIYGNLIGTDSSGTAKLGNKGFGIDIGTANNTVGGVAAGQANVIAFNDKAGIGLEQLNTDTGNTLSANSIYSNQTLGIDLGESGVPLNNNLGGSQPGPNRLLNYPVLTSASASGDLTTITGSLTGMAGQVITIQFFSNTTADLSGHGQGQSYIGSISVTPNNGGGVFTFVAPSNLAGQFLTATATDQSGDTSEFAADIKVGAPKVISPVLTTTSLAVGPATLVAGKEITLTAIVSAADSSMPTGDVSFFVNGQALAQPVALQVVNGQDVATLTTSLSTPGLDAFTAQYGGDSAHLASLSNSFNGNVVATVVGPTVGPAVVSVEWVGSQSTSTTIVLQFNQALASKPAQTTDNYTILTTDLHGRFGKGSKRILVKSAVYNPASETITLHTSHPLNVHERYQLTVNGASPTGLTSTGGVSLELAQSDNRGDKYIAILDRQDFVLNVTGPAAKERARIDAKVAHPHGPRKV